MDDQSTIIQVACMILSLLMQQEAMRTVMLELVPVNTDVVRSFVQVRILTLPLDHSKDRPWKAPFNSLSRCHSDCLWFFVSSDEFLLHTLNTTKLCLKYLR